MKVTGGSDKSGTLMRPDVHGGVKKYVLLANGIGIRNIGGRSCKPTQRVTTVSIIGK